MHGPYEYLRQSPSFVTSLLCCRTTYICELRVHRVLRYTLIYIPSHFLFRFGHGLFHPVFFLWALCSLLGFGFYCDSFSTYQVLVHDIHIRSCILIRTRACRPGGVAGYPRACDRSISRVRVPPSAHSYKLVGTFSCAQIDSREARTGELATVE